MSIKASKESLTRAEILRNKWKRPDQRPEYDLESSGEYSIDVLCYDPVDDMHAIGWFNFDTETWSAHEDFYFRDGWCWCYLSKPDVLSPNPSIKY